jgi:hypothetical protein
MIEDVQYRQSSQYRYWSYTSQSLRRIRQETNDLASQRVRSAFRRARAKDIDVDAQNGHDEGSNSAESGSKGEGGVVQIETLTVDEELKIVEWGCGMIVLMGEKMTPRLPSHVVVSLSFPVGEFMVGLDCPTLFSMGAVPDGCSNLKHSGSQERRKLMFMGTVIVPASPLGLQLRGEAR